MNPLHTALLLVVLLGMAIAQPAQSATVNIAPDGMLLANGERLFVVGLYENPKEDEILKQAADAGFNLIQATDAVESLDRLHQHGLFAWVNTGACIDFSTDKENRAAAMMDMVQTLHSHPALLVWEVPDEALWNCWHNAMVWRRQQEPGVLGKHISALEEETLRTELHRMQDRASALYHVGRYEEAETLTAGIWDRLELTSPHPDLGISNAEERARIKCAGMIEGYQRLKQIADGRPVWMNHAPRNQIEQLAAFNAGADLVGCDIYPVPFDPRVGHSDLKNRSLSSVGDYTERMQAAAPGKPVWMVLQAFGWGDIQPDQPEERRKELRRPTLQETRFMAYDAIVRGARGILYWGSMAVEKDSPFWQELLSFITELKDLKEVLAAPDADLALNIGYRPTFGSVDRSVVVLAKAHGDIPWLLAVNEWTDPLYCTITGLDSFNGSVYRERISGETVAVAEGALSFFIAGQTVHILEPVGVGK